MGYKSQRDNYIFSDTSINNFSVVIAIYVISIVYYYSFFYPAFTTLYEFEPPHSGGSEITHKDTSQSIGLLCTSDKAVAETST